VIIQFYPFHDLTEHSKRRLLLPGIRWFDTGVGRLCLAQNPRLSTREVFRLLQDMRHTDLRYSADVPAELDARTEFYL
jgi:hypothetical protein